MWFLFRECEEILKRGSPPGFITGTLDGFVLAWPGWGSGDDDFQWYFSNGAELEVRTERDIAGCAGRELDLRLAVLVAPPEIALASQAVPLFCDRAVVDGACHRSRAQECVHRAEARRV